ncbi:hypothetical protein MMC29_000497 [Sticta canariensis]|nr:hypothetical protein [Sticta canariensis]
MSSALKPGVYDYTSSVFAQTLGPYCAAVCLNAILGPKAYSMFAAAPASSFPPASRRSPSPADTADPCTACDCFCSPAGTAPGSTAWHATRQKLAEAVAVSLAAVDPGKLEEAVHGSIANTLALLTPKVATLVRHLLTYKVCLIGFSDMLLAACANMSRSRVHLLRSREAPMLQSQFGAI